MKPKPMPPDAPAGTLLADTRSAAPPLRVPTQPRAGQPGPDQQLPAQQSAHRAVLQHLADLRPAVASLEAQALRLTGWGVELAGRLLAGQRLLAAGNGGSAAEAQHLTAELVGRFDGERRPFSAIALHAETSAVTAIGNDYGFDQLYARQVLGHGRSGDVLILLSTSGRSPNLLRAVEAARRTGMVTWALTGRGPNPLSEACDDAVLIDARSANAQEAHLIALHAVCRAFDAEVSRRGGEEQP